MKVKLVFAMDIGGVLRSVQRNGGKISLTHIEHIQYQLLNIQWMGFFLILSRQ